MTIGEIIWILEYPCIHVLYPLSLKFNINFFLYIVLKVSDVHIPRDLYNSI